MPVPLQGSILAAIQGHGALGLAKQKRLDSIAKATKATGAAVTKAANARLTEFYDDQIKAVDKNIAVVINRPFINGDYFGLIKGHELPEWAAEFDCESWAQFSLKYILSNPAVNCVLTETSNPKHVVDNLDAGIGAMPDEKTRKKMREHLLSLS